MLVQVSGKEVDGVDPGRRRPDHPAENPRTHPLIRVEAAAVETQIAVKLRSLGMFQ